MRVLVVSNFYPPHHIGGYELRCREVVQRLAARCQAVHLLTGSYRCAADGQAEPHVTRALQLAWGPPYPPEDLPGMLRREVADRRTLAALCRRFRPDVIDVWGMEFASHCLAAELLRIGRPVHFMLDDAWLLSGRTRDPLCLVGQVATELGVARPGPIRRVCCWDRGPAELGRAHATFVSRALYEYYRSRGFRHARARVRLGAIDTGPYRTLPPGPRPPPLRLLCLGQIAADRGQADLVAAAARLRDAALRWPLRIVIAGRADPPYLCQLQALARRSAHAQAEIAFLPPAAPEAVNRLYARSNALVFASRRPEEALPRVLMEAAAAGLPIIATDSGGQREVLADGRWGRLVRPGRADDIAAAIRELMDGWPQWRRRARRARLRALSRFDIGAYVDQHREALQRLAREAPSQRPLAAARLPSTADIAAWCRRLGNAARQRAGRLDVAGDPELAWRLGVTLKRTGQLEAAERVFARLHRAHRADRTHVRRAAFHRAEIALVRGRWPRAAELLRGCLAVAPDHRKAAHDLAAAEGRRLPRHLAGLRRAVAGRCR